MYACTVNNLGCTASVSTLISTFNSLTLSPALAALLLRPRNGRRDPLTWLCDMALGWLFWLFNRGLGASTNGYAWIVGKLLRVPALVLLVYGGLLVLTYWGFLQLPTGFIPLQDKGYMTASVQLPDSASAERTKAVFARLEKIALETPGIKNVNSVCGNSFTLGAQASNFGSMFIILKTSVSAHPNAVFRLDHETSRSEAAAARARGRRQRLSAPCRLGLPATPAASSSWWRTAAITASLVARCRPTTWSQGNEEPGLTGLFTVYKADSPQLFVDVNRDACLSQGVTWAMCSARCRRISARVTSTTSIASAAPGRWWCRPTRVTVTSWRMSSG